MNVGGCFDKYISAAIWPPQIKILDSAPGFGLANFGKVRQSSCAQDKVKHKSIKPDTPWNRVSQTKCKTFFFFLIFLYTFFFFSWNKMQDMIYVMEEPMYVPTTLLYIF